MPASSCITVEIGHAKVAQPASYFNLGNTDARTDTAKGITSNFKAPRHNETDNHQQRTSRLVATNHDINDVDWLQDLSEQITWIQDDPIHEISSQLRQRNQAGIETSELHIIAHGNNGDVKLGNTFLTKQYLEKSAQLLQEWKLEAIYLWSCEAGRNTELIETLGALTGADVYASTSEINSKQTKLASITGKEASLEALIGQAKLKQWNGKLASTQVLDANYKQLDFDADNITIGPAKGSGLTSGGEIFYSGVITIDGQIVDARVKVITKTANLTIDELDKDNLVDAEDWHLSPRFWNTTPGDEYVHAEISFYENGTYTGTGTGNKVTLKNVVVNTYDIDASQYQEFKNFQSYELADRTGLTVSTQSDGAVRFSDLANQTTSGTQDAGRARIYYDSIDTFEIKMGTTRSAYVYFYLDFQQGPAWTGDTTTTDTPAANFTWSTRNLSEAVANDGSFSQSATITLNNPGTTVFAGSNGDTITHSATNVPDGLTTVVTRASDTTATITVTGNATNHTTSDDLSNIQLEFENSAFVVGSVGASSITDARITNFGLSFIDDTTRPTIAITDDDADNSLSAGESSTLTFTLSEASTDFVEADTTVTGGSLSNWTAVSSTVYTATFTPPADSTTDGVIHVANDKFSDAAGNTNQDENDANNTVTFTVDTTPTPTPSPSPSPSPTPSPEPSPSPAPTPTPEIESASESAGDIYLLIDTSTSMLRSGAEDRRHCQSCLTLKAFTQDIEKRGFQFQRTGTKSAITASNLLKDLSRKTPKQAIKFLNNYSIIGRQDDGRNADSLDINLITYDYGVKHKSFLLSRNNPNKAIDIMRTILSLDMAGEKFGNSIKNNKRWKELNLAKPNQLDLFQANKNTPSNLYAGTEMLGALEGLEFLLNKKASDPSRQTQSTTVAMVMDGRPERRSWWDTRTDTASDSITGQAIPLPKSLGQEAITTSGLLYDTKGNPHFFKNNQGQWQWKEMQKDLNTALDRLADQSTNPTSDVQVNLYGLGDTSNASLDKIYQDLASNQIFDNSSSSWSYSHQTIQSLGDINF